MSEQQQSKPLAHFTDKQIEKAIDVWFFEAQHDGSTFKTRMMAALEAALSSEPEQEKAA